jgi:N-ethylmaleimide reductase
MSEDPLFTPVRCGALRLRNRVVMAPMTRSRACPEGLATALMGEYYAQRAEAGLIVSEGIVVSRQGAAYPRVPGLYSEAQAASWAPILQAVHERGGLLVAQLWHVGRQSHSSVQPDGKPPWGPSAIPIRGESFRTRSGRVPYEIPRVLSPAGIGRVIGEYADAAARAVGAGFDGVELHGANGYLIDQFLHAGSNHRTDGYGGSIDRRARFLLELVEAVAGRIGADRTGVRLSPWSTWMDMADPVKAELFTHVVSQLSGRGLAYLHLVEPEAGGPGTGTSEQIGMSMEDLLGLFDGPVIRTGRHTAETAVSALEQGCAAVGFGRAFIAHPDLPYRLRHDLPLREPDRKTMYAGGAEGYTTYPISHAPAPAQAP